MHTPAKIAVATEVANIMQRATFAAVELGNFPLQSSDVWCAYDNWNNDLRDRKGFKTEYLMALAGEVLGTLRALGFRL